MTTKTLLKLTPNPSNCCWGRTSRDSSCYIHQIVVASFNVYGFTLPNCILPHERFILALTNRMVITGWVTFR